MAKQTIPSRQFKREFCKELRRPITRKTLEGALKQVTSATPSTRSENRTPSKAELTQRYRMDRSQSKALRI